LRRKNARDEVLALLILNGGDGGDPISASLKIIVHAQRAAILGGSVQLNYKNLRDKFKVAFPLSSLIVQQKELLLYLETQLDFQLHYLTISQKVKLQELSKLLSPSPMGRKMISKSKTGN